MKKKKRRNYQTILNRKRINEENVLEKQLDSKSLQVLDDYLKELHYEKKS